MIDAIVNTIAVVGVAAFSGVMLCIAITLGRFWRSLPPNDFLDWFADNNAHVAASVPVTVVPAFVGLGGSLWTDWGTSAAWLWALSASCMAAVMAITGAFFVPANTAFAAGQVEAFDVPRRLRIWLNVHTVRIALGIAASVVGCIALRG